MSVWHDFFDFLVLLCVVLIGILTPILIFGYWGSVHQCSSYEKVTGRETKHASLSDCYVNVDGEWEHWSIYSKKAIARDGLEALSESAQ